MKNAIIHILTIALISACNPCRYVSKHSECINIDTIKIYNTETVRDSVVYIEENESTLNAWFECDSLYNVVLKRYEETKTSGISTNIIFRDNKLQIRTYTDSIAVLNKIITKIKDNQKVIVNPVNTEMQKKLQKVLIYKKLFYILLIIFSIYIIIKYLINRFL